MGLELRKGRDGATLPYWYGTWKDANGKRRVVSLGVPLLGTAPASLLDLGDPDFEASRADARAKLAEFQADARQKGQASHLVEKLIEAKTGSKVEHVTFADLADRWAATRKRSRSGAWTAGAMAAAERFREFMATRKSGARFLYETTQADAEAFYEVLAATHAPSTAHAYGAFLRAAFRRFLPHGSVNPFDAVELSGRSEQVHRKPFTAKELATLLDAAREDDFLFPLVTTAVCSGMRRGDVAELRWADVDLAAGMLTVKTSKTGDRAEVPIFPPLRAVLASRSDDGSGLVFPEAARMLRDNPTGLTWRFKALVARAFGQAEAEPPVDAATIAQQGADAIAAHLPAGPRRDRVLDVLRRYCEGASVRDIETATGVCRATVSNDLHDVERWTGARFLRTTSGPSVKSRVASMTRRERATGRNSASLVDWHALRTTWVSLALTAGVPMELVRRVTGHATVEVVLKHYFRPGADTFREVLGDKLPDVLTGGKVQRIAAGDELATLAGKVASGTATDADKARLKALARKL